MHNLFIRIAMAATLRFGRWYFGPYLDDDCVWFFGMFLFRSHACGDCQFFINGTSVWDDMVF